MLHCNYVIYLYSNFIIEIHVEEKTVGFSVCIILDTHGGLMIP